MSLPTSKLRPFVILAMLAAAILMVACTPQIDDSTIRRTTIAEVQTLMERQGDRIMLLDSRNPELVAQGTIPGAVSLRPGDLSDLTQRDPWLASFATLIVFGDNPGSTTARAVAKRLMAARFGDVRLMEAGLDGWKARGLPVGQPGTMGRGPAR